jgi:regulator of CtrA degradation
MVALPESARASAPIVFAQRLAMSSSFKALFKEGMKLVEDSASYLDGPGRQESRALSRVASLAYASESMRLTTRIMQLASWLLLQRAVNEGEMTTAQAYSEKHRVRLSPQNLAASADVFRELPPALQSLCLKSLMLQRRIIHLDGAMLAERAPRAGLEISGGAVAGQLALLRAAFAH